MRTKYSFYNFLVSIIANLLIPILGFVKVRLFIASYGQELNGLYIVLMQIVTYINICESSFSLAFRQMLFKPLADDNKDEVIRIYSGVRKVYNIVGGIVIVVGILSSLLVPYFVDSSLAFGEISKLFLILCLPFGISYFLLPPSLVVIADQKEYKISAWIQTIAILRMILMIVVIKLGLPYIYIYIIEGLQVLISNFVGNRVAIKNYPWLKFDKKEKCNSSFVTNSKYTIIQNLSKTVMNNIDSVIISNIMTLVDVSIYGSYSYLKESIVKIINIVIVAPMNSFGNLINSKNDNSYAIFQEFYTLSTYIATIISVCMFVALKEFIFVWLHDESYILPTIACFLFTATIYYLTQREAIIVLRDVKGLFIDARNNAIILVCAKVIMTILFAIKFGLVGVFFATLFAYIIIDLPYNPSLLYRKAFQKNPITFYKTFISRMIIALAIGSACSYVYNLNIAFITVSTINFLISIIILGISVVLLTTVIYFILIDSFRDLIKRITRLLFSGKYKNHSFSNKS